MLSRSHSLALLLLLFAGAAGVPSAVSPPIPMGRIQTMPTGGSNAHNTIQLASANDRTCSLSLSLIPSCCLLVAGMVGGPPPMSRHLSRMASFGLPGGGSLAGPSDWRALVTVEERVSIRRRVRDAYARLCPTYEALLDTLTAVDEELLFACTQSRIDYFKAAIDWDARIQLKRQQLTQSAAAAAAANGQSTAAPATAGKKRAADDLSSSSVSLLENNSDLLPPASSTPSPPPHSASASASAADSSSALSRLPTLSPPQLTSPVGLPKSPSKDMASSLVALGKTESQSNKRQRN